MLATPAAFRPAPPQQLDSLAAEVDALADVEALLERYSNAPAAGSLKGREQSLAEEERQLAVIAQLDHILSTLQATTAAHTSGEQQQQQPIERADADEDDLTFLTQLVRNSATQSSGDARREEHKETITTHHSHISQPLPAHAELDSEDESESEPSVSQQSDSPPPPAVLGDGEGFRLTSDEAHRLADIDALLAALQCEEREGKKRRFVHIRSKGSRQRGQAGKDERRTASLPTVSKPTLHSQRAGVASAQPAAAFSLSSASASVAKGSSLPPVDGYCADERQQLSALDAQLAAIAIPQPQADGGDEYCDEWLPLEHSQQQQTVGCSSVRPHLPPEQSWLYVSRLRDLYPHHTPLQSQAQQQCYDDPFSWLDSADEDGSAAAAEQVDRAIERDSILPDTDSEDDSEAGEEKQQTSSSATWHNIRGLPAAPPPPDSPVSSPDTDSSSLLGAQGGAGATLAERERHAAASSDAARRRVRRLIAEAEERKHAARQQQQQPSAAESGSAVHLSGRAGRVRTSEERSGGAQRKVASVLLSALPQRPPTR